MSREKDKELYQHLGIQVLFKRMGEIRSELVLISQLSFKGMFKSDKLTDNRGRVSQDIKNIKHVLREIKRNLRQE